MPHYKAKKRQKSPFFCTNTPIIRHKKTWISSIQVSNFLHVSFFHFCTFRFSQIKRQILETELSSKSKDLATLAMDVFSKEKVIENLRESMQEEQKKGNISVREMNALLKRIQQTEGNLEFWSIYQKNFDLIHEHFFRNLQERYPSLTSSDLKFCALLRLNLSTKQIATFTNLSVRGVESARLRLRRKFSLSADQNLVDFLISF